jgi:hypothetical protein
VTDLPVSSWGNDKDKAQHAKIAERHRDLVPLCLTSVSLFILRFSFYK